jgi:glycerophosphoryl diester phosphodiesterase
MIERIGHRGAPSLATENTLAGFAAALELGVDGVELDVRLSADGAVLVMHDDTVDRTTCGHGAVAELTAAQLAEFGVPRLADVLDLLKGRCVVTCESKSEGTPAPTIALLQEFDVLDSAVFTSFCFERIAEAKALDSRLAVGGISGRWAADLPETLTRLGASVLDLAYTEVTPAHVAAAHAAGLRVRAWTVNEVAALDGVVAAGADGVMSDRPEWLMGIMTGL